MICSIGCRNPGVLGQASGCPGPQKPDSNLKPMCTRFVNLCVLADCGNDSDCPDGSHCVRNTDTPSSDPNYYASVCANSTISSGGS